MNKKWLAEPDKRPFLLIIAIIVAVTVVFSISAGHPLLDILGYLGWVTGITYIFFTI